ncbi:synapse differentiation-inducing gene protein 1-like [Corticium candelabrum]|uniref:synapse differentiation-inducing gene protein 1-like n=1 Tax=Corticium candelabrum TaxID=121492 RepID=UPI002E26F361|nr:synapse differentiation-inducing gene protein 1-like [Corticium candelabrum]XP_062518104.1 synapse differentiation-inducing gene protein 1-like [Corticium candelabrum]XP_062518106.1 synapse differentiation-inducing gene protein 1-like [Corticium candelabrum]
MEQKPLVYDSNMGPPPEYDEHPGQFFYPPVGYHHVTSHVHVPVHTYQPVMSTTMMGNAQVVPRNYLCLSIVSLLFCWPFGLAALLMTIKTRDMIAYGDIAGAMETSRRALIFAVVGLVSGFLLLVAAVALVVA